MYTNLLISKSPARLWKILFYQRLGVFQISVMCSATLRYYFVLFRSLFINSHNFSLVFLYFFPLHRHSEFIRALLFSVITLASIKSFFFSAALIFSLQGLTDCSFLLFFPLSLPPFSLSSASSSYGYSYLQSCFLETVVFCSPAQVCMQNFWAFFRAPEFECSSPHSDLQ